METPGSSVKWRLGIREKFALVALLLVLASLFVLHLPLSSATSQIVVEHELVDLADEAELRCWEVVDSTNQLRALAGECAAHPETLHKLTALLSGPPLATAERGLPQWWDNVLAVRHIAEKGTETALFTVQGVTPPGIPLHSLKVTRDSEFPHLSPVLPGDLPLGYGLVRGLGKPPEADAPLQRVPVMWGLCRTADRSVIAILLPLDMSGSARHLTFLLDGDGLFLQHAALRKSAHEALLQPFSGLDLGKEAQLISRERRWSGQDANVQVQRGTLFTEKMVPEPFHYLEGDAATPLISAIQKADKTSRTELNLWAQRQALQAESKGVRFGGANINSRTVRLLGRTAEAVEQQKKLVEEAYRGRFPEGGQNPVSWHKPVELLNADAQIVRFFLNLQPAERPGEWAGQQAPPDPPLYFVYAAFREELAESVDHEFRLVRRKVLVLGLGAGAAAFLIAMFFVRPLRRITRAAQSVTSGREEPQVAQLQHQIETVRRSLPVARRDEVGDISRALESLLRQVLNGHERLRQLNADLESRVRERTLALEEANTELRGLAAAKDAFLASVSHELRQPLNSIFGYLQFLELSQLDAEQSGDVAKVRNAAVYLRRLIDDILDYQKIIMGGIELDPEPLDGAEFFRSLADSMKPQAAERSNALILAGTDSLGTLRHDRARLQQVFVNLLSNACKFTEKGTVTLTAAREHDGLTVTVADTGRGMTADEKRQLFTRFKKLSSREGNKSGTGLGLVICKGLCELMGGSISCESEFGLGTTFTVRLPAELTRGGEAPAPLLPPVPAPEGTAPLILVIDDDAAVRELMQRSLEAKGYRVITAGSGTEGIELAKSQRPAAITLDVVLPERDGWEILSELKTEPATADIPVVIVTFVEQRQHGYALGASDYLVKPVAWEELSSRLARLTGGARGHGPVLVVDDDAATRELFRRALERDGQEVSEAADGAAALAFMETQRPALILLDLMMPVMDGFEFVEHLRRREEWSAIPVVVVTARHATAEDRERLSGCVRAILEKGGSPSGDLLADILALIHRSLA